MNRYAVYGACLESELEFPELPEADGMPVKWRFGVVPALPTAHDEIELGTEHIYGHVYARLYRHRDGHRVVVDDTGTFDLKTGNREVLWQERRGAWPDFVRAHCIGRVLATAMFLDGWLPLHGSAVATPAGVIAFLAPKGFGKSSLALALTRAGARLVTDDTLPVEPGEPASLAWPGVHSLRLGEDAIIALGAGTPSLETHDRKLVLGPFEDRHALRDPAPLCAIYLLDPVLENALAPVTRTRLPQTLGAVGVVAHVKVGRMLGATAAPALLERAARVVESVPVYSLQATRHLDALPAIADTILGWHRVPA